MILRHRFIFWFIFLLVLIDRAWVLHAFGFQFTSNDDLLFWLGAKDYSHGIFHEPFMYGQNYNFMVESVFAAPFLRLGIAPEYLFPIVTSTLALIPFLAFGMYYLRKGNLPAACLFVAMPLLLPVQYDILTTITRGFVTGIFFFAFYPRISRMKKNWLRHLLLGATFAAAYVVNPNSLPLILFFCVLILLNEFSSWPTFIFAVIGTLPFFIINHFAKQFYITHPEALIHEISPWMLAFHWDLVWEAFGQLDRHFAYLSPWWPNGSVALGLLFLSVVGLFWIKRPKEAIALSVAFLLILFSFAFAKVHDGKDSVFFAYSRMFLALPLLLCLAFAIVSEKIKNPSRFAATLALICVVFFSIKLTKTNSVVTAETESPKDLPIRITRVDSIRSNSKKINDIAQKENAELILGIDGEITYPDLEFYLWGGEVFYGNFKPNLVWNFDRRSWRKSEELSKVHTTILIVGGKSAWTTHYLSVHNNATSCSTGSLPMFILHNNHQSTHDLLQELGEIQQ